MKRGFIVVLATLATVAAGFYLVVRPYVAPFTNYGSTARVQAEISNIELALTKMLRDVGKGSLRDFFDPVAFEQATTAYMAAHNTNLFEASSALYTRATYALINHGRGALTLEASWGDSLLKPAQQTLDPAVVSKLGTSYMTSLEDDHWGNPYQIFPGPWPPTMGPVLFRSYRANREFTPTGIPEGTTPPDQLTVHVPGADLGEQGFPALAMEDVYIWSFGENEVSDQPRYDPSHTYAPPARNHYRNNAPDEYLGGGDDLNNWDGDVTFMEHYK